VLCYMYRANFTKMIISMVSAGPVPWFHGCVGCGLIGWTDLDGTALLGSKGTHGRDDDYSK
jgi:hypothetical protein